MRRREFIAGLGAAITGSIRTNAQVLPPVSLVGYLYAGPAEGFAFRQVAFRKGLAETDYFEGCNVAIETHWARNESFRLADLAGELVDRGVAVLVASGNAQAVLAAKAATTTIPIVFGLAADPVEIGLVSSLDHPGGNITGHHRCHLHQRRYRVKTSRTTARPSSAGQPCCDAHQPE